MKESHHAETLINSACEEQGRRMEENLVLLVTIMQR